MNIGDVSCSVGAGIDPPITNMVPNNFACLPMV